MTTGHRVFVSSLCVMTRATKTCRVCCESGLTRFAGQDTALISSERRAETAVGGARLVVVSNIFFAEFSGKVNAFKVVVAAWGIGNEACH